MEDRAEMEFLQGSPRLNKASVEMEQEGNSQPIAELCEERNTNDWICIRSHLKREHIAAANLRQIQEVEVFNPQLRLLRLTRRGRAWRVESLFPNYIFARFSKQSTLEKVRYTPSVKSVLRFGESVAWVPDAVIKGLESDLNESKSKVLTDTPEEGDEVEVVTGAFAGQIGPVCRVLPAKQRVQILLEVMGRSIAAELSLNLVMFRKKNAASFVLQGKI
jgi:transcriptional antiterminator RfaH